MLCDKVLFMSGSAVVGVNCDQEGAEHAAPSWSLGGSGVQHWLRGGVAANLYFMGMCEQVADFQLAKSTFF